MAVELLRKILDVRESLQEVKVCADAYGYDEEFLPQIAAMQKLERELFQKAEELDKPD
jgi:hypothetical protein